MICRNFGFRSLTCQAARIDFYIIDLSDSSVSIGYFPTSHSRQRQRSVKHHDAGVSDDSTAQEDFAESSVLENDEKWEEHGKRIEFLTKLRTLFSAKRRIKLPSRPSFSQELHEKTSGTRAIFVQLANTVAHRLAFVEIPTGLLKVKVMETLADWTLTMKACAMCIMCHVAACWLMIWSDTALLTRQLVHIYCIF